MVSDPRPPAHGPSRGGVMRTTIIVAVLAILGTAALAFWSSTDSTDDATVQTAVPEDPTVQPNREAPTASTETPPTGEPVVPR
ncbi:hypothetical protein [Chthonobacter rhizosphaerae]|uniref:hypothetical protein n=1 Tax=Chthonobacter rhizosphaerae TaxID=2735553 RepID=UPI0015EE4AB7|nr:hypothetical protein [Chthonobacter rhizosphaerae]